METELYPQQIKFMSSEQPIMMFCGGVGSGKTQCGAFWAYDKAYYFPGVQGFIGANTYLQLHKTTLVKFFALLDAHEMPYVFGKMPPASWGVKSLYKDHKNVITMANGTQILTYSLDNFKAYRGIEIGWFWIDETRDTKEEAFNILVERLRGYKTTHPNLKYEGRVTTSPNGFDWVYRKFADRKSRIKGADYVTATSYDNPFNPPDYAHTLEARLGAQLAKQQVYGQFINLASGRAFDFDRERNTGANLFDPRVPLTFSLDFNVAPLCGVVMQFYTRKIMARLEEPVCPFVAKHKDSAHGHLPFVNVLDEVFIDDNGKTREACRQFAKIWGPKLNRKGQVWFWGDVAGKARDTRGSESDITIMRKTLTETLGPHRVKYGSDERQRRVKDGINACNALINPSIGAPRLIVNPDNCVKLLIDLENVAFRPGTEEIDKSNDQLTHMADAFRYPIAQQFGITETVLTGANV